MRRALALVVVAGCGRIGFGALGDSAGLDAFVPSFYMSPAGDDANPGTREAPWGTFSHSLAQLHPGDRLTLLDGDYDVSTAIGVLDVECGVGSTSCAGGPCANGTAGAPIIVRADHERRAHVFGRAGVMQFDSCSSWQLDGLYGEGTDEDTGVNTPLVSITSSIGVTLSHMLLRRPSRAHNNHAISIEHSQTIDIGNSEIYDFSRAAILFYVSHAVTVHGVYANGRGYPDIAGYASVCPGGDEGVVSFYDEGSVVTDTITEGICDTAYEVDAGPAEPGSDWGENNSFTNDIALGNTTLGFQIFTGCTAGMPCTSPDVIASANHITNSVAIDTNLAFTLSGQSNTIALSSAIGGVGTSTGISMYLGDTANQLLATGFASSSLIVGFSAGVIVTNQSDWGVTDLDIYATDVDYNPSDPRVVRPQAIDPALGTCMVYEPATSPLLTAASGSRIGADIRTRVDTGGPTWVPGTGMFTGCGAVIPGVNDDPATACIGVHARLQVAQPGCPLI